MKKNSIFILLLVLSISMTSCYYRPNTPVGSFARGGDVSWLSEMEHDSVRFYDAEGKEGNCLDIMQSIGMNAIRLRVWVNHATGWSNKPDVVYLAKRAAKQGLRIMIDFHYSDFFADPSHQEIPAAWKDYTYEQICEAVQVHTLDVLYALKEAGVKPEWVQIGNETPNGMLWPIARVKANNDWQTDAKEDLQWSRYAELTTIGYKAAKEAFPEIEVIVHIDNAYLYREEFFNALIAHGGEFDMIGLSHYPMMGEWSGLPWQEMNSRAEENVRKLIATFHKPVMIAEVGIMNSEWFDGQYIGLDSMAVLSNEVMTDFVNRVSAIDSCMGIFYWEPQVYGGWRPAEYIPLGWGSYPMGAFGNDGRPSPALQTLFSATQE